MVAPATRTVTDKNPFASSVEIFLPAFIGSIYALHDAQFERLLGEKLL
jgi:hypothetical protein